MAFQHDLSAAVQGGLRCVDLRKNVLAGHVLVDHAVDGLHLPDDLLQPAVQIVGIHALLHCAATLLCSGIYVIIVCGRSIVNTIQKSKRAAAKACFAAAGGEYMRYLISILRGVFSSGVFLGMVSFRTPSVNSAEI